MLLTVIISVILSNLSVFLILYVMGLRQAQEQRKAYLNELETQINNELNNKYKYDLESMQTYNDKGNFQ